jgi:hypothetical protein
MSLFPLYCYKSQRVKSEEITGHMQVSEWLLFNASSAMLKLYHSENKLIFNEMMMKFDCVMVSMLALSAVDCGVELRSVQTKEIGICYFFVLKEQLQSE